MPYDAHDRLMTLAGEAFSDSIGFSFEPVVSLIVPRFADGCAIELFGSGVAAADAPVWSPFRPLRDAGLPVALLDAPATGSGPARARMAEEDVSLLRNIGVRSTIGVPLKVEGTLVGLFAVFMTRSGRFFAEADVPLYQEVGRQLMTSARLSQFAEAGPLKVTRGENLDHLTRRRLTGELRSFAPEWELSARRRQQEAVARLARFALSETDLIAVMSEAMRLIRASLDLDSATVLEFLPDEEAFVIRAAQGFPQGLVDDVRIRSNRSSLAGFTLQSGSPVLLEDIRTETRFDILGILRDHGVRSCVSVLVEGVGGPWGVLAACSSRPRGFSDVESDFMQTMADVLGQAVERHSSLQALDTSKREFEALAENAPDIILRFDRNARCIYVNSAVRQIGVHPSRIVSKTVHDFPCGPESAEAMQRAIQESIERDHALSTELTLIRADGSPCVFDCRVAPERGSAGPPRTAVALLRDVTERRTSDEWLRYQATLLDTVGEGVTAIDLRGRIIYWNRQAELLHGWTFDEVLERDVLEVIMPPEGRALGERMMRTISAGSEWAGELLLLRRDGTTFPAFVTSRPVRDERGEAIGIVAASTDLTERIHLEEQLRQAQKMEAVGRLAGGVAHDFNNILTTVAGYTDLLLSELDPRAPAREFAEEIDSATDRAIRLTAQLLAFSRKQVLQPRVIEPFAVVQEMKKLLQRVIGENIDLAVPDDGPYAAVLADPTQLEQVILNLAVNARDAMPLGGTLSIVLESVVREGPFHAGQQELPPGRYLALSVSDTGAGIPPEVQPHVFEPFYTTKPKGKGTGLGLATVYGIVQQSGGGISMKSTPGEGTTFIVYLPEVGMGGESVRNAVEDHEEAAPGHQQTVLVVEDERSVRMLLMKLLPRLGYRVIEAANGVEALELCREHAGTIDLVLSDVIMPMMGGEQLAVQLGQEFPNLPVLFMSGYTDDMLADRNIVEPGVALMKKPFTVEELRQGVRDAIRSRRSSPM